MEGGYLEQEQRQHLLVLSFHLFRVGNVAASETAAVEKRARLLPQWLRNRAHTCVGSSGLL